MVNCKKYRIKSLYGNKMKPTIQDPDTGRPVYIGDGLIPQVERFASKYAYTKLSVDVFNTALNAMVEKAVSPKHMWAFIVQIIN